MTDLPAIVPAAPKTTFVGSVEAFFNSPRGHALLAGLLATAAQVYPVWAPVLNNLAVMFTYGAVVAGAPAKLS